MPLIKIVTKMNDIHQVNLKYKGSSEQYSISKNGL